MENGLRLGEFTARPRLNELRKERAITQLELAKLSGVPQGTISRFDKNSRHEAEHVLAILSVLGVAYEELFDIVPIDK